MMPAMGLGGAKRWGIYSYYMRVASHKVEDHLFLGGVDPCRQHVLKKKNVPFPGYFTSLY